MSWKLRPKWCQPSGANHNCDNAESFMIAINHSGKFVSLDRNVYCGGSVDFIDNCDADLISLVGIMSMVKEIVLENMDAMNLVQWLDYDRVVSLFVEHEPLICSGNQSEPNESELPNVVEPFPFVGNSQSSEERISQENAFVEVDVQPLVPPVTEKMPGRPRKHNRRKDPDEGKRDSGRPSQGGRPLTLGKKGVKMTCSYCGQKNHNIRDEQGGVNQMINDPNGPSQAFASVGPERMDPASVGPDQMDPASVGPDQMDPASMDNDPDLEDIYSVIDEFDAFDASLPNNEQPLARPPQSKRRNTSPQRTRSKTSEKQNAMKTTETQVRSIEKSPALTKRTRESIDKVTGIEKIVHTQNSQTTKDVHSTKKNLGLKRKLDLRKMSKSQGQTSTSAPEDDRPHGDHLGGYAEMVMVQASQECLVQESS
ncbi:transposon protein [Striga asiatica]|uniref:Transposon protein n=1 Tax=Striga asiatica TaxID=4170 RepID=A0A5A7NXG8_STRAF|nr:transposon protein [Striga asiatica]